MLSNKYRLPASIKLQGSTTTATEFFRILTKENSLGYNRFGFIIGKKIDKRAVVRNRLKRILREAVRDFVENPSGKDILFIVTKTFYTEKTDAVIDLVQTTLRRML